MAIKKAYSNNPENFPQSYVIAKMLPKYPESNDAKRNSNAKAVITACKFRQVNDFHTFINDYGQPKKFEKIRIGG